MHAHGKYTNDQGDLETVLWREVSTRLRQHAHNRENGLTIIAGSRL